MYTMTQPSFFPEEISFEAKSINDFKTLSLNQKKIVDSLYTSSKGLGECFLITPLQISQSSGVKITSVKNTVDRLSKKGFFSKDCSKGAFKIFVSSHNFSVFEKHKKQTQNLKLVSEISDTDTSETQIRHNRHHINTEFEEIVSKNLSFLDTKNEGVNTDQTQDFKLVFFKALGLILCSIMTWYLIFEGVRFFNEELKTGFDGFKLAFLLEGLLVFFAGYRFSGVKKVISNLLLFSLFFFSVGSYSYFSISTSLEKFKAETTYAKTSSLLEKQINEKAILINEFKEKGWIGEVRKLSREKQALTGKLLHLQESGSNRLPFVSLIFLGLSLSFRVLIQLANLFLVHEVFKL